MKFCSRIYSQIELEQFLDGLTKKKKLNLKKNTWMFKSTDETRWSSD